jgi:peptidoglycan/LPS O-acetylase OafA/YrhL
LTTIPITESTHSSAPPNWKVASSLTPGVLPEKPSKVHLPALDGVRAIAILMVIVYHALNGLPATTGSQNVFLNVVEQGWVGVDLFFVLSGFLITGILMDVRTPVHALRRFYARRILRIVPVYVAFLLFSMWIAPIIGTMHPEEVAQLQSSQLWYWTYSFNLMVALHTWQATSFPLAHLWSLSVEEQFYLLWPLAVLLMSPLTLRRAAVGCIVAAELFRLAFILGGAGGQVNFVLLPCRMDSLAAGAFLACAYRDPALWSRVLDVRKWLSVAAVVPLIAIALYRHKFSSQAPLEQLFGFPSIIALASVVVASAVGGVAWLSSAAMQLIAKISYGMYIWHLVVMRLIVHVQRIPDAASPQLWWVFYIVRASGTVFGAILLALISWYAIEQPFLRLKRFVPSG